MNHRAIRILAILSLVSVTPVLAQDAAPSLVVIDLRPKEEKDGFGLAPLNGKCNENVFRVADVASDPMKVEVLKEDLVPLAGTSSKTLTVLNWSIYYNKQVQSKGSMLEGVGIQGYSIPGKNKERHAGSKCSKKESAGGWYQASELSTVYFPLISEFEGTLGGKPVSVRVVYSPEQKLAGKFEGDPADTEALVGAVHKTSEAVAQAFIQ